MMHGQKNNKPTGKLLQNWPQRKPSVN